MQLCGLNNTIKESSIEKKTFVVKSQLPKEVINTSSKNKTNSSSIETKQEEHKSIAHSAKDKVLKSIISLKERPTKKRTISIDLDNFNKEEKQKEKEVLEECRNTLYTKRFRS